MLATMERLSLHYHHHHGQSMVLPSPPVQSPNAAYPPPNASTYGLPGPDIQYPITTTAAVAHQGSSSCLPPVQSPPPYQTGDLMDPTGQLYPLSSSISSMTTMLTQAHQTMCPMSSGNMVLPSSNHEVAPHHNASPSPTDCLTTGAPRQHQQIGTDITSTHQEYSYHSRLHGVHHRSLYMY